MQKCNRSILTGERPLSANSGHSDAGRAGFRIEIVVEGGISHGDCIEQDAHAVLREAWKNPLSD
jgi:hypothetical protein